MKIKAFASILVLSLVAFTSCKSDSTSSNNNGSNNNGGGSVPTTSNTMTYTADGTSYTQTAMGIKVNAGGQSTLTIAGADATGRGTGFTLTNISGTGSHDVGLMGMSGTTPSMIIMNYTYVNGIDTVQYSTPTTMLSSVGKLNITEMTATTFKGTFDATLTKLKGATGAATVHLVGGVNSTVM